MRILVGLLLLGSALSGQTKKPVDPFLSWWSGFKAAVVAKDASAVGRNVRFPLPWENGPTREIKSQADLAARFDFFFTAEIKGKVAKSKPVSEGREGYTITWKARGNEYSLYFKDRGAGYALDGLSEGPP